MSDAILYRLIRERHGEAAALLLCEAYGGSKVTIPLQATERHRLAGRVGIAVLQTLVDEFRGETIAIPLGPTSDKARRQAELEAAVMSGEATCEIVRRLRVTHSAVTKARGRLKRRRPPCQRA